ncbi:MAG: hypothetical protein U0T82_04845 [Bacteroidales bacterium]
MPKPWITGSCILIFILCSIFDATAQTGQTKIKVGTYDSRMVVYAYSRSDFFRQYMMKFKMQSDSATSMNDTTRLRELSVQAISFQHLLHQMVFSSGSVTMVMKYIQDGLPEVARQAGVSVIVSKFELSWLAPGMETVDLSRQVCALFKPTENIENFLKEIEKADPVPIEEMGIEEEMLVGFCNRFGKN